MKTYKNLYSKLCSLENLELAFEKAKKRKSHKPYVKEFEENLKEELNKLHHELINLEYEPKPLKRFVIRDPKTREIHASNFRDRVVHHALVIILNPIFEKTFIHDSYASRIGKGTHKAVKRFDEFKRKATKNGRLIKNSFDSNSVIGYSFKADIRHYFETVDHEILLKILKKKVKDERVIWLVGQILGNFNSKIKDKGMPLGNLTSQFFANVYLNELDYFVKHRLKAKYYIRYVDDFVIVHDNKCFLEYCNREINIFLVNELQIELHKDKSKIIPLRKGITLLGYRNFYHYKLLRKSNIRKFENNFKEKLALYEEGALTKSEMIGSIRGWTGYAMWADTYKLRKNIMLKLNELD